MLLIILIIWSMWRRNCFNIEQVEVTMKYKE